VTHLSDILDPVALDQQVADGYIRMQRHPTLPLRIHNYTDRCVYDNVWTLETTTCRGLIVSDDDEIISRCLTKFWSLSQHEIAGTAHEIPWDEPFRCYAKLDGSMGQMFPTPDGYEIATRGSFTSDQAIHATRVWKERYEPTCRPDPRFSYIMEIVYPANRIVVDYKGRDDLWLLGAVEIETGMTISPDDARRSLLGWTGPQAYEWDQSRYHNMGQGDDPENEEGFVLWFPKSDFRLKAKFATYLRLHRLMTGTSSKTIWRCLVEGREDELAELPDELHPFATKMADSLKRDFSLIETEAQRLAWIVTPMKLRKDQAKYVLSHAAGRTVAGVTFALLDGKDPSAAIWKAVEPEFVAPFGNVEAE
jgi:RNA ligase